MGDETSIKVSAATRDRLAALAGGAGDHDPPARRGDGRGRPTQAEAAERAEQARAELASVLGTVPSTEAEDRARGLLQRLGARQDPAEA
ncbi:hypothetical protein [Streptomyces sp. NPDC088557]|uniref:hypothetical protein n=1 Tax=Streptomyces sp. NPDC088557 TaxID=3365867 RepID=UPI0038044149